MGDNPDDLPYRAEYAKSGRAKCKACKADIPKVIKTNMHTIK